jgi:hypothetical protein
MRIVNEQLQTNFRNNIKRIDIYLGVNFNWEIRTKIAEGRMETLIMLVTFELVVNIKQRQLKAGMRDELANTIQGMGMKSKPIALLCPVLS